MVAWLFIVFGMLAAIEVITRLFEGTISLNFGVIGIFVGRGLLKHRPGWRTCALVLIWFGLILPPLLAVIGMGSDQRVHYSFFHLRGTAPGMLMLLPLAACWALAFWQYKVLTRSDIRALFLQSRG